MLWEPSIAHSLPQPVRLSQVGMVNPRPSADATRLIQGEAVSQGASICKILLLLFYAKK
jgi:hypothetical protein